MITQAHYLALGNALLSFASDNGLTVDAPADIDEVTWLMWSRFLWAANSKLEKRIGGGVLLLLAAGERRVREAVTVKEAA